jgi:3D (Asp-Asp-Asp) domain-containing protein
MAAAAAVVILTAASFERVTASPLPFKKVDVKERIETRPLPAPVRTEQRRDLSAGQVKTVSPGTPGKEVRVYSQIIVDGKVMGEKLVKTTRTEPKPRVVYQGIGGGASSSVARSVPASPPRTGRPGSNATASRAAVRGGRVVQVAAEATQGRTNPAKLKELGFGPELNGQSVAQVAYANMRRWSLSGGTLMRMEATAYTPDAGLANPTFITFTGRPARRGMIAVDPRVVPLHSLMYVEGYGWGIAADTGGAIKGNKIDVCVMGLPEALQWGRRQVKVLVFPQRVTSDLPRRR